MSKAIDIHYKISSSDNNLVVGILQKEGNAYLAKEKDQYGSLPIHTAVESGHEGVLSLVKELVRLYPEGVRCGNKYGQLPLHYLRFTNMDSCEVMEMVKYLLEIYPEALYIKCNKGCLPLHLNFSDDSIKLVEYLFENYPDWIKTKDGLGELPLHCTCYETSITKKEIVRKLCHDAYPEAALIKNKKGQYPSSILLEYCTWHLSIFGKPQNNAASTSDHPIINYLEGIKKLPKYRLNDVKLLLNHFNNVPVENEKIEQLKKQLMDEKYQVEVVIDEKRHDPPVDPSTQELEQRVTNLEKELLERTAQLDAEKSRAKRANAAHIEQIARIKCGFEQELDKAKAQATYAMECTAKARQQLQTEVGHIAKLQEESKRLENLQYKNLLKLQEQLQKKEAMIITERQAYKNNFDRGHHDHDQSREALKMLLLQYTR